MDIVRKLDNGNVREVISYCAKEKCNYVVYHNFTVLNDKMENYGFEKVNETGRYAIYKLKDEDLFKSESEKILLEKEKLSSQSEV